MQELKIISEPDRTLLKEYNRMDHFGGIDYVMIDWNMGNTCNYHCSYCDPWINNGTYPWVDIDIAFEFVKRVTDHYKKMGKLILWNLLGGEPTVWKDFIKFFKKVKEYDPTCKIRVLTNGSRTVNWWNKASSVLDDVIISYHPENADIDHLIDVTHTLRDNKIFHTVQICLYPPYLEQCYRAAVQFYHRARCNSVIIKSLKVTLCSPETFVYDSEYMDKILKFDGNPIWIQENLHNTDEGKNSAESNNDFIRYIRFVDDKTGATYIPEGGGNELMRNGQNTWEGWDCYIGIETLVVTMDGTVTAGSSCNHDEILGNINDPKNIIFPDKPVRCKWKWCSCLADIECTKVKPE